MNIVSACPLVAMALPQSIYVEVLDVCFVHSPTSSGSSTRGELNTWSLRGSHLLPVLKEILL